MKNGLITILLMFVAATSGFAQGKGWETDLELNIRKGFQSQVSKISCGIDVVEGYNFDNGFYLGGGIGAVYADGLMQEIHQFNAEGAEVELSNNTVNNVSWGAKAFLRAKYDFNPGLPFVVCDAGYSQRIGDSKYAMNTGFFAAPGIGGSIDLFGKRVYGIISYDVFQWSYEYHRTPHKDSDPFDQRTVWTSGLNFHIGIEL